MSVKIRMRRMGGKNDPFYRIVATDSRNSNSGSYLENVGWYDPKKEGMNYELKLDRVEYWKKNGAIITPSVLTIVRKAKKASPKATPAVAA